MMIGIQTTWGHQARRIATGGHILAGYFDVQTISHLLYVGKAIDDRAPTKKMEFLWYGRKMATAVRVE